MRFVVVVVVFDRAFVLATLSVFASMRSFRCRFRYFSWDGRFVATLIVFAWGFASMCYLWFCLVFGWLPFLCAFRCRCRCRRSGVCLDALSLSCSRMFQNQLKSFNTLIASSISPSAAARLRLHTLPLTRETSMPIFFLSSRYKHGHRNIGE